MYDYNFENTEAFIEALMRCYWVSPLTDEHKAHVVELVKQHNINRVDFAALDEKPGHFGYRDEHGGGWHWKLRQVRNDKVYGPKLYAALEQEQPGGWVDAVDAALEMESHRAEREEDSEP